MLKSLKRSPELHTEATMGILIICWWTEKFDKQMEYMYLNEIHIPSSSLLFLVGTVSSFQPMKQPEHYPQYIRR